MSLQSLAGGSYICERSPLGPTSANWQAEIDRVLATGPAPDAFVWDDLYYVRGPKLQLRPMRLRWAAPDALLLSQVDSRGRCAIRSDLVADGDTSAALTQLAARPGARIVELPGVMRFVPRLGGRAGAALEPATLPRPSRKAASISVITSYRDRPELMQHCLSSLAKQKLTARTELLLVNNQSTPANFEAVKQMARELLPPSISVTHIEYDKPFNLSAQDNLGAERAQGEILVMLNNDAQFVDANVLQEICDWAAEPGTATVGPRFIGDGDRLVSAGVQIIPDSRMAQGYGIRESELPAFSRTIHKSGGASFACAAIARKTWHELGGLPTEDFPVQYNDADLFLRALDRGLSHLYIGNVTVFHQPGSSEVRTREKVLALHRALCAKYPNLGRHERVEAQALKLTDPLPPFGGVTQGLLRGVELYSRARKIAGKVLAR